MGKFAFDPPEPERITSASVQTEDGSIHNGINHYYAYKAAAKKLGGGWMQHMNHKTKEGFSTSHGRFVGRQEANDIANKADQLKRPEYKYSFLGAEDLKRM